MFQQVVYVNYKLEEFIYLLDVMNSVYDKVLLINPFVMCNVLLKVVSSCLLSTIIFSIRVKTSWNFGDNRNFFFKLKSKLELYHVVLTTPKTSSEKLTLTVVELQQLQDIDKTDSKEEISCLKWTTYNGRREVCANFQTDKDKLNIVYRY